MLFEETGLEKNPVFCFTGSDYPVLFFSLLKQQWAPRLQGNIRSIDGESIDFEQFKSELSVAFLATSLVYWCGNISAFDAKLQKKFLAFAQQYQGPHKLVFFIEKVPAELKKRTDVSVLELSAELTKEHWHEIAQLFFEKTPINSQVIDSLVKKVGAVSLDTICLLLHYATLLSRASVGPFIEQWLPMILNAEKSLFTLSAHFFAQKSKEFFALWYELKDTYPPQFWISYWSEQLFRATFFVKYAKAQNFLEAKKIAYRLPFTFIKKDWKSFSTKHLIMAHDFLYDIDYQLKNGGQPFALELFYSRFFV